MPRLRTVGLVLVRQMPGSANGVMFITIEDETGIANLLIWPKLFEQQRRIIIEAGMPAVAGRIQRQPPPLSRLLRLKRVGFGRWLRTARSRLRWRPLAVFAFGEAALFQRLQRKGHCPIVDIPACGSDALGDVGGGKSAMLVEDLRDRRAVGLARLGRLACPRLAPELWPGLLFCLRPWFLL